MDREVVRDAGKIAAHIAERCRCELIVDGFCGVGGNAIQFAMTCEQWWSYWLGENCDGGHNAAIYGVQDRIEFIIGDYDHSKSPSRRLPLATLGQNSLTKSTRLANMGGLDGIEIFEIAARLTRNVAYFIPRNRTLQRWPNWQVMEISRNWAEYSKVKTEQ